MALFKVTIEPANTFDLAHISANLRESDKRFAYKFSETDAAHAITSTYNKSINRWCVKIDGVPVVLFGIVDPDLDENVYSWMGATDDIAKAPIQIARKSKKVIHRFTQTYKRVIGFIDAEHLTSIKWHKFLGYELIKDVTEAGHEYYTAILEG